MQSRDIISQIHCLTSLRIKAALWCHKCSFVVIYICLLFQSCQTLFKFLWSWVVLRLRFALNVNREAKFTFSQSDSISARLSLLPPFQWVTCSYTIESWQFFISWSLMRSFPGSDPSQLQAQVMAPVVEFLPNAMETSLVLQDSESVTGRNLGSFKAPETKTLLSVASTSIIFQPKRASMRLFIAPGRNPFLNFHIISRD